MVAMAGQFLTGDKSSTSFAVGTIMVVAVAMLGSLTALPAAAGAARPSRRQGPHPRAVPAPARPGRTESRVWARRARPRCCARPAISAVDLAGRPAGDRLARRSHFKVHNTGVNDLPPNLPGIIDPASISSRRSRTADIAGDGRHPGRRQHAQPRRAVGHRRPAHPGAARAARCTSRSTSTTDKTHTVTTVALPLAGNGTDHASTPALGHHFRNTLISQTLGQGGAA